MLSSHPSSVWVFFTCLAFCSRSWEVPLRRFQVESVAAVMMERAPKVLATDFSSWFVFQGASLLLELCCSRKELRECLGAGAGAGVELIFTCTLGSLRMLVRDKEVVEALWLSASKSTVSEITWVSVFKNVLFSNVGVEAAEDTTFSCVSFCSFCSFSRIWFWFWSRSRNQGFRFLARSNRRAAALPFLLFCNKAFTSIRSFKSSDGASLILMALKISDRTSLAVVTASEAKESMLSCRFNGGLELDSLMPTVRDRDSLERLSVKLVRVVASSESERMEGGTCVCLCELESVWESMWDVDGSLAANRLLDSESLNRL